MNKYIKTYEQLEDFYGGDSSISFLVTEDELYVAAWVTHYTNYYPYNRIRKWALYPIDILKKNYKNVKFNGNGKNPYKTLNQTTKALARLKLHASRGKVCLNGRKKDSGYRDFKVVEFADGFIQKSDNPDIGLDI